MFKKQKVIHKSRSRKGHKALVVLSSGDKGLPDKNKKYTVNELRKYSVSKLYRILQGFYSYKPKEEPDFLPPDNNGKMSKYRLIMLILKCQ